MNYKYIFIAALTAFIFAGCKSNGNHSEHEATEMHEGHDHEGHDHEGEDHDHEGHNHEAEDHDHEGHNHEAEDHDHEGHNHEGEASAEKGHEGEIVISEERQETLGICTEIVEMTDFSEVIRTSGKILSSNGDEMTICAKSDGIVKLGNLTEGSAVGKGAKIAVISTKGIGSGDLLAKAKLTYETAKKEYERDITLFKDNIVSESHLDQSKLAYEQAKNEYEALSSGGTNADGVVVNSPMGGFIKEMLVNQGDYVTTGQSIATISQNRRLQLRADVSEKYYSMLGRIDDATFKSSGDTEVHSVKALSGRLLSYGRSADGDYYIPVTFEFDNKGSLVQGSFVEVYLKTSDKQKCLNVPVEALIEDQGIHYVFVQHEADAFLKEEVKIGQTDGQRVRILSGINEGDRVAIKGAMQIKLSSVAAVPAGHTHNH